jgi:SAM-dependent methyltransferase
MEASLYQQMRELEDRHWWFRGRRAIVSSLLQGSKLPKDARILDLGCGTGGNLAMLSEFGHVVGAELDEDAAQLARERELAPIVRGRLPDGLPLDSGSFQCVTLLDVLEHIEDDRATLETVHDLLAPSGRLIITVPAFPFLWGPHDEAHHHQRRYRAGNLRRLLEETGYEITTLSYCNTWLFPVAAAVRLLRRIIPGGAAGAELSLPPAPVNNLLAAVFASERHLLQLGLPFGISLAVSAKKVI